MPGSVTSATVDCASTTGDAPGPVFVPSVAPDDDADGTPLVFRVRDRSVAVADGAAEIAGPGAIFLGSLDGRPCWAVDVTATVDGAGTAGPDGAGTVAVPGDGGGAAHGGAGEGVAAFSDLYSLWGRVGEVEWAVAGRAVQLVDWARTHRFCGRCATATEPAPGERAMRCPACGLLAFPRLAPAAIVLIERADGRALLARNVGFPGNMYSCLAGFVEPGETVEQAVHREVREEVGVELGAVRYQGSQPWPFPHSLMLGFTAEYRSGEIRCDEDEIADARWFARDALPAVPPGISIARRLIDDWVARGG